MLTIHGARRVLDSQILFTDFDLVLYSGQCVAITGSNGTGKSTLLRCILDDERLNAGSIEIGGYAPNSRSSQFRSMVSSEIGDTTTFFDVSLAEHLTMLATTHRMVRLDIAGVLGAAGLSDVADRFPHTLSTGQHQRFVLASALMRPARLLVLDEPERGLDIDGVQWLVGALRQRMDQGCAIVMATHSDIVRSGCADFVRELGR